MICDQPIAGLTGIAIIMNHNTKQLLTLPQNDFFNTYEIVRSEVESALQAHKTLYGAYERREKYFDGEVSKSFEERKKLGLGWMDCWNYGKPIQMIKAVVLANVNTFRESLFLSHPRFFSYKSSMGVDLSPLNDKQVNARIAEHISFALGQALEIDARTGDFLNSIEYPSLTFGWCAVQARENDWLPEVYHPRHVAYPAGTKVGDVRRWTTSATINADDLYNIWAAKRNESQEILDDPDSDENFHIASNYVLEGVEEALWLAFREKYDSSNKPQSTYKSFNDICVSFEGKQQYFIQNTNDIKIAKLFNQELDKSLSETWIVYDESYGVSNPVSKLLFKKNHGRVQMDDVHILVKDSGFTDNGVIVKLGGISKQAVEEGLRYDAQRNQVVNKAKVVGMPYIQTNSAKDDITQKLKITGGFGVITDGASFVEHQPNFDLSSHISLLNFQEKEYNDITAEYQNDPTQRLSSRPTKGEVGLASSTNQTMRQSKFSVKLPDYGKVVMMMLRGLKNAKLEKGDAGYKAQKYFWDELINKLSGFGFDTRAKCEKLIDAIMHIPVSYYGMSLDTLRTMLTIATTPQSRLRITRMMLMRMGVPRQEIDYHAPYESDGYISFEDDALIAIENNMFSTTSDVVYSDSHDPLTHAKGHLNKAVEIFEAVGQEQLDPIAGFKWASNLLSHNEQHIAYIKEHPFHSGSYDEFAEAQAVQTRNALDLKVIAERIMEQNKQQQQESQQQGGDIPAIEKAKIAILQQKAQDAAQRKEFLTMANMRTKEAQRQFNNEQTVAQNQFKMKLNEEQHAQKNRIMLLQAAAKQLQ